MGSINYVERSAMKLCCLILTDKFTFKKAMFCFPSSIKHSFNHDSLDRIWNQVKNNP